MMSICMNIRIHFLKTGNALIDTVLFNKGWFLQNGSVKDYAHI